MRETEYVRPGECLVLLDEHHRELVVRGRDRRRKGVNWKVVAWIWMGASLIHLVNHWVAS